MDASVKQKLLKNESACQEINKHLWIESEKAGHDIGFDNAAEDWLKKFSEGWMKSNIPAEKFTKKKQRAKAK